MVSTVKHSPSVMIWGAIFYGGRSDLCFIDTMVDRWVYIKILEDYLLPIYSKNRRKKFIFQDDGAPCHRAKAVDQWKKSQGLECLEWVGQSPDMNPIEHVWDFMGRELRILENRPKNKKELKSALQEIWEKIPQNFIDRLILSVPRRLKTLFNVNGGHTGY